MNSGDVEVMLEGAADAAAAPAAEAFVSAGWAPGCAMSLPPRLPWGGRKLAVRYHKCSSLNIYSERDSCTVALVQTHNPSTSVGSSLEKEKKNPTTCQGKAGGITGN